MEMDISHHLFDLRYMVTTMETVHLGPFFGYVSNDLDPYLKVTEVNILKSILALLGGMFCGYET